MLLQLIRGLFAVLALSAILGFYALDASSASTQLVSAYPPPDNTPPDTFLEAYPKEYTSQNTAEFILSGSDDQTPLRYLTFECSLNNYGWSPCPAKVTFSDLAEGSYNFQARAIDKSKNIDHSPIVHYWTVDLTPPETYIAFASDLGVSSLGHLQVGFLSSEDNAHFQCRTDEAGWSICTSPIRLNTAVPGDHRFEVYAVDLAGNADPTPEFLTWQVPFRVFFPDFKVE